MKFDIIVGNPPFSRGGGPGNIIWNFFIRNSFDHLETYGYLLFLTPCGWRKPLNKYNDLYSQMCQNRQMLYLEIHDFKDGMKNINVGIRYDIYLIQNKMSTESTFVVDMYGKSHNIDMKEWEFLPHAEFETIKKIMGGNDLCVYPRSSQGTDHVLFSYTLDTRSKYISKVETDEFKYPVIHSNKQFLWSSKFYHEFKCSKICWSLTGLDSTIDMKAQFQTSQLAMSWIVKSENEAEMIQKARKSPKFMAVFEATKWHVYEQPPTLYYFLREDWYLDFQEGK